MIADVDFFVLLPDGTFAILECKTTSPDATGKWWDGDNPAIPVNYQLQGRHYMSTMHINKIFYACLHGNSMNYLIVREMDRDLEYESEMIAIEEYFWNNYIQRRVPPPYMDEDGDVIIESVRRHSGPADPTAETIVFNPATSVYLMRYLELQREKSQVEVQVKRLEGDLQRIKGMIVAEMGAVCTATCTLDGTPYVVTYNPFSKPAVSKENLIRLKAQHPEIYDDYVTATEYRRFNVKQQSRDAA